MFVITIDVFGRLINTNHVKTVEETYALALTSTVHRPQICHLLQYVSVPVVPAIVHGPSESAVGKIPVFPSANELQVPTPPARFVPPPCTNVAFEKGNTNGTVLIHGLGFCINPVSAPAVYCSYKR